MGGVFVGFGGEVIFYIIVFQRQVSTNPPGLFRVKCQFSFHAHHNISIITSKK